MDPVDALAYSDANLSGAGSAPLQRDDRDVDRGGAPAALGRPGRGWTQDSLVKRANMSKAMFSKVERGENNSTLVVAAKIAAALGLTMSPLIGVDERMRESLYLAPA